MNSAGNDIIALNSINKQRSNDYRFYAKILSVSEQAMYHQAGLTGMPFEHFVWLLWSIKESAYKYLKRAMPDLVFSPVKIIIQHIAFPDNRQVTALEGGQWEDNVANEDCYKGSVIFGCENLYFRSTIHSELIATLVSKDEKFEHDWWGVRTIDHTDTDHQSKEVRSFLLRKLNTILPGKSLRIEKTSVGYPIVLQGTKELNIPVSFAHHGRFVAYSFLL